LPAINGSTSAFVIADSGNASIDALLYDTKWSSSTVGASLTITYSFPSDFTVGTFWANTYNNVTGQNNNELISGNNPHGLSASEQFSFTLDT